MTIFASKPAASSSIDALVANQVIANASLAAIATKGQATAANSIPVVLSSDGPFATNFGTMADSIATNDTGSFSLVAFIKRGLQNWASLLAKIPALGVAAKANSMPVTISFDQGAISVSGSASVGTAPTAPPLSISGVDGSGNKQHILTDTAGRQSVREDSVQGVINLVVGTSNAAGRQLAINCTTAGNVTVTFTDSTTLVWPVAVGATMLSWSVTSVNSFTGAATFYNLK